MTLKVKRVTHMLMDEAGGSAERMSQLVANVNSQRVMQPFLPVRRDSPQTRFALNALQTVEKAKSKSIKAGSPADLLRRNLIVAGAEGPLSKEPVSVSKILCM